MNDTNITSYGVFENAVSSTKAYGTKIDTAETDAESVKTILSDGSVLMGPFQDECINEMTKLNNDFSTMKSSFTKISNFLIETANQYQTTDEEAAETAKDSKVDTTGLSTDIAAKKKAFIGDVDDTSKYFIDPRYPNMKKDLRCFDNDTGEEITDGTVVNMKVGETKVLTVAVPYNAGAVKRIIRTTAADVSSRTDTHKITSSKSDINPDPNKVDYVNYQSAYNHWPEGVDLHTNYYDWIITADKTGKREISQTCEYESTAGTPKSMIGIVVNITN
ncbi:MAG: hypothetical protein J6X28_01200 [Bacilli bacterium]|nr:hypothetical protein [Bacilli bacterium]